ncbi:MAG: hypothetical protein WDW36_003596 [Sanguina aurantia]
MSAPAEAPQDIKLLLARKIFLLKVSDAPGLDKPAIQAEVLAAVDKDALAPLYSYVCAELGLPVDEAKLAGYREINAAKIKEIEDKIVDAQENLGETEVRDALLAKAEYLASIGDKDAAVAAFTKTEEKTAGGGNKLDLIFSQIRLFMLYEEWRSVQRLVLRAKKMCEEGGDWERKNKLKVYEAVLALYTRDFKHAAELLLDSTATFTATELFPYSTLILYAVVASLISVPRVSLKAKVVDSPEILTVLGTLPHLEPLLHSLYYCRYREFFSSFVEVVDTMKLDPYLQPHIRYYMREIRVVVYSQFLESYKSVTLASMAAAFDVSTDFLDAELADFIVAGRLHAKIDKVAGIVETNRPDAKNALIQKLSKVIDIE